jgi:multidrug transporter EmrE-like cation transporter
MVREVREWLLKTSREKGEELIGATVTFLALLTATATLAGHRAHTEEVVSQTKATDQWGFYQAKHIRAHMYGMEAEKALATRDTGVHELAGKYLTTAIYEQCGAPAAKSCNLENCRTITELCNKFDLTKLCTVPVLKDSPELEAFYKTNLVSDPKFLARFDPALKSTNVCADEPPAAIAQKKPASKGQPADSKSKGAADIIDEAKSHDDEVSNSTKAALRYDISEIVLEISIMICSVGLVVGTETYRKSAFFATVFAMIVATAGVAVSVLALPYTLPRTRTLVAGATLGAVALVALGLIGWVWLYRQKPDEPQQAKAATSTGSSA